MREIKIKPYYIGLLIPKELRKMLKEKWSTCMKEYEKMVQDSLIKMRLEYTKTYVL